MSRQSSAVMKAGKQSKAVKKAEKLKELKAQLKEAVKVQTAAVKALDKADAAVMKIQLKIAKLDTDGAGDSVGNDNLPLYGGVAA